MCHGMSAEINCESYYIFKCLRYHFRPYVKRVLISTGDYIIAI